MENDLSHNSIRFSCTLAHVYPMARAGEVDLPSLVAKIRSAIVKTVNEETKWHEDSSIVRATGGNGNGIPSDRNHPIHDEIIVWDFS